MDKLIEELKAIGKQYQMWVSVNNELGKDTLWTVNYNRYVELSPRGLEKYLSKAKYLVLFFSEECKKYQPRVEVAI